MCRVLLISVIALGAALAPAPAQADGGGLYVTPASGPVIAFPTLTTADPCPTGSELYAGVLKGAGMPPEGQLAVLPSAVGFSTISPFAVEMTYSFADVASDAGVKQLRGRYTIALNCQDPFGVVKRAFTADLDFTAAGFTALGAAAAAPPGTAASPGALASDGPGATTAPASPAPAASAPAASAAPTAAATASAEPTAAGSPAAAPAAGDASSGPTSRTLLVVLAVAAALGAIGFAVASRRRTPEPEESPEFSQVDQ